MTAWTWAMPIARWSARFDVPAAPRASSAAPVLGVAPLHVDPMLRRRLSPLAKSTLLAAQDCIADISHVRVVYASAHGDLARTHGLLEALAQDEPLSPTAFGLSVLNATAGIFSIARADPSPATAVSAGQESLGWGLLEAYGQWHSQPEQPVLLMYADAPLPEPYAPLSAPVDAPSHVVALLIDSRTGQGTLHCEIVPSDAPEDTQPQSSALVRGLETGQAQWHGGGRRWTWRYP